MYDYKMYVIVNQDIKMGKGKVAAQVGHAINILTYQYATSTEREKARTIAKYMSSGMTKIILKAPQQLCEELEKSGLVAIRDAGHTQIAPNSLTAIGVGIFRKGEEPNFIKELKLL